MPDLFLNAFNLKPAAAIEYLRQKGLAISWNWFDVWREAHARAFTVAKAMRADVLQDIRSMVDKALDEGIPFTQFKKELAPRLQEQGWWGIKEVVDKETGLISEYELGSVRRLKTIYQTNLQTAYMAGRYKEQVAVAEDLPYWQYVSIMDGRTTERCRSLNGRVFPADDPVWDTIYPPNHWGCRARVRALTHRALDRKNLTPESSEGRMVVKEATIGKGDDARTVSVTGVKLTNDYTYYPDPGWDYNPGKAAWKPDLSKYDRDIRDQYNREKE